MTKAVKYKTMEMDAEKYALYLVRAIDNEKIKTAWSNNDNTLTYDVAKMFFQIDFPSKEDPDNKGHDLPYDEYLKRVKAKTMDGLLRIKADAAGYDFLQNFITLKDNELDQVDLDKSIFKDTKIADTTNTFKVGLNKLILAEFQEELLKTGIKSVLIRPQNLNKTIFKELTLVLTPDSSNAPKTISTNQTFQDHYSSKTGYKDFRLSQKDIASITGEESKDIKLHNNIVGRYYPRRNLVVSFLHPFNIVDMATLKSYGDNDFLLALFDDFCASIKKVSPVYEDGTEFETDITIEDFMKDSESRVTTVQNEIKKVDDTIKTFQAELNMKYERMFSMKREVEMLTMFRGEYKTKIIDEIKEAKKLKILEDVKIEAGRVLFKFIPTTLKCTIDRNNDYGKLGIKEIYLGSITVSIGSDGYLKCASDAPAICKNAHPHANDSGSMCLGEGEGKELIHQLIGERKFADLALMLWAWIKTGRQGHEYMRTYAFYDDRLQQGLPVFDASGTRIEINDADRIKTGEQLKLTKHTNYDANIKKFASFKSID